MQTSVTFKNLEPSEHLKAYVSDKLNRFDKLLDNPAEAVVTLLVEKHRHIAEINITGDRLTINGTEETGDMYSAIDMVLDKLEKQLKRSKQKIRERRASAKGQTRTIREEPAAGGGIRSGDQGPEPGIQAHGRGGGRAPDGPLRGKLPGLHQFPVRAYQCAVPAQGRSLRSDSTAQLTAGNPMRRHTPRGRNWAT